MGGKSMKRFTLFTCLALVAVFAVNALAADVVERPALERAVRPMPNDDFTKAGRDTCYLLGAPGYIVWAALHLDAILLP